MNFGLGLLSHTQRIEHISDHHTERLIFGTNTLGALFEFEGVHHTVMQQLLLLLILLGSFPFQWQLIVEGLFLIFASGPGWRCGGRQLIITCNGNFDYGIDEIVKINKMLIILVIKYFNNSPWWLCRAWFDVVADPLKGNMDSTTACCWVCCCCCCCWLGSTCVTLLVLPCEAGSGPHLPNSDSLYCLEV